MTVLLLGLVNWLATTIIVDGAIFDEPREWVRAHAPGKLAYLVGCHLCTGTWVGFAQAAVTPYRPLGHGFVGLVLAALAYKAIGHLTLEVVARLRDTGRSRIQSS